VEQDADVEEVEMVCGIEVVCRFPTHLWCECPAHPPKGFIMSCSVDKVVQV